MPGLSGVLSVWFFLSSIAGREVYDQGEGVLTEGESWEAATQAAREEAEKKTNVRYDSDLSTFIHALDADGTWTAYVEQRCTEEADVTGFWWDRYPVPGSDDISP